ncbi:MAG TPA: hypothetical protein VHF91_07455 [Acidimicrobiales bacterium]|nr:hypothetical protein [Acidimicrobiales bacterium]
MAGRVVAGLVLLVGLLAGPGTAMAGGGRLSPVQDRYDAGGVATLVGYTGGPALDPELLDVPFYAYLRPIDDGNRPALDDTGRYVGELVLAETGHGGYLQLRVSISFEVPDDLPPGEYELTYCDDPCTGRFLGDLIPSPLSIGVDPIRPVVRDWALDDPEVANLAPGALLVGPGLQTPAEAVRTPPSTMATPTPAPAPVTPTPAPAPQSDAAMDWPLPTALVVASAAVTALVLRRRPALIATRRWPAGDDRTPGAVPAGRG